MITVNCPNCGSRNSAEFRYGGEYNSRPSAPHDTNDLDWSDFVYMRDNKLGNVKEWWYHRSGCKLWFIVERHTYSNEINATYFWKPAED
jgi:heterotetrameric sarcosine oxidase delta subunit